MEIIDEQIDSVMILTIKGRLDASNSTELKTKISSLIDENKKSILVDMSGVDFVDSSGLGSLVTCLRSVAQAEGKLKITSLQHNPKNLFETTRLDRVFEIFDDRKSALKTF
jgi:anti-sigma B factor antagonist